jgi:hypothetical protein
MTGVGLRVVTLLRREGITPFFETGVGVGVARSGGRSNRSITTMLPYFHYGGGLAVPAGERAAIVPELRRGIPTGVEAAVSIRYRFR